MNNKLSWHTERTNDEFDHKGEEDKFQDAYKSLIKESAQNSLDAVDSSSKKITSKLLSSSKACHPKNMHGETTRSQEKLN